MLLKSSLHNQAAAMHLPVAACLNKISPPPPGRAGDNVHISPPSRDCAGDNVHTARHIARECGILYEHDHQCLEGPVFRAMDRAELIHMLPNLRVGEPRAHLPGPPLLGGPGPQYE